jgi:hypothetical protein
MTSQTVRDSSKDCSHGQFGRLTRECRARATCRVHTRTRSGTSTSCNESRPLTSRDKETAGAVTWDTAQQMNAGAIRQPSASSRGKCYVIRASRTLGNRSLNQLPVWQMFDNRPAAVLIPCPPALTAQASGGREPCVRACPYSSVDMRVGASTQPQDSGRGYFQATIWRDRASSHN